MRKEDKSGVIDLKIAHFEDEDSLVTMKILCMLMKDIDSI